MVIIKGGKPILKEDLEKVLNEYLNARETNGTTSHPIAYFINDDFKEDFENAFGGPNVYINSSAGQTNLAFVPWVAIADNVYKEREIGLDVAYLFKSDMTGVYLSLRVFLTSAIGNKYGDNLSNYIKNKSRHIREFLEENNKITNLRYDVDLASDSKTPKRHSLGNIVAKYYEKNNIPSTEILKEDMNNFLEIYNFILENYEDKTDISLEEWIKVLVNRDIVDSKMFSILEIMRSFNDNSATYSQISEKRKDLGFDNEENYTSVIKANSERIKNFLDKKPIFNDDETEQFWSRFFYGKRLKDGFLFTLKDELVEALDIIEENNMIDGENSSKKDKTYSSTGSVKLESGDYNCFYNYLRKKGYLFDKKTIENYLLSLKVKPFLILTGNSGTGKTKLAQLFAKYCFIKELYLNKDGIAIETTVNTQMTPSFKEFEKFYPFNQFEIEGHIDGNEEAKAKLKFTLNSRIIGLNDEGASTYLDDLNDSKLNIYLDTKDFVEMYSYDGILEDNKIFTLKRNERTHITYEWSANVKDITFLPLNRNIKCKRINELETEFCLEMKYKIKATERTPEFENAIGELPEDSDIIFNLNFSESNKSILKSQYKYKIIPVGANWTENRNIVGYFNIIENQYQSTPAYDLIQQANKSNEPHFLILDEMNLSHVERYFADFLSAIESGEKVPIYGEEDLSLPPNLFIIGTVNVDETTYMFSPKVLDRANVIEFETYSSEKYMDNSRFIGENPVDGNGNAPSGDTKYLENPLAGSEIQDYGIYELYEFFSEVKVGEKYFWDILSDEIHKFQKTLGKSRFDFGFRVINEIVRFMAVAYKYEGGNGDFIKWKRYFDACIIQKMLPKLHGSEKIIGNTLKEIYDLCVYTDENGEEKLKYPESARKLEEMIKVLKNQRYVSFIN